MKKYLVSGIFFDSYHLPTPLKEPMVTVRHCIFRSLVKDDEGKYDRYYLQSQSHRGKTPKSCL
jgi:hypothetical protein